ncbi:MAG: Arginine decarboxylase (EC [uncultured Campylobacterales bacterium]|uniref:Arginine decarboxylase (EC) n=1 Tax=uncultured Campylobacterales bacterium TaxID=352960 RepID=A0A6S6SUG9_9BACT|nr:MAG: Arginine decarboxylase (EC [uncultured Campylobacterales bacterium]
MLVKDQNKTPLIDALKEYQEDNITPFDVPGHKHGAGAKSYANFIGKKALSLDVNSMRSLDNLSNPISVIKEAEDLASDLFWSDHAFFLVNGTTVGIEAMIMSVCRPGDKIILPRNVHKSTINGLILSDAIPAYIEPEIDQELGCSLGVSIENVEKTIARHPNAKAILITNPTYYGFASDIKSIINLAHKHGMAVLVDEAHGSHIGFSDELPISAMEAGADMSAISMHKTGGSLTQSSILLMNEGFVTANHVKTVLNLLQTTSASYLLMGSLDSARHNLAVNGAKALKKVIKLSKKYRKKINEIPGLYAFGKELVGKNAIFSFDETKLSIQVKELGLSGFEVYDILRDEYKIQVEFGDTYNILAIISLGDTEDSLNTLYNALLDISKKYKKNHVFSKNIQAVRHSPDVIVSPRHAFYSSKKIVPLEESIGHISAEFIMAYPPGIPILVPGERISKEIVQYIKFLKDEETTITGMEDAYANKINVLGM